jgi:hypothetical protein
MKRSSKAIVKRCRTVSDVLTQSEVLEVLSQVYDLRADIDIILVVARVNDGSYLVMGSDDSMLVSLGLSEIGKQIILEEGP